MNKRKKPGTRRSPESARPLDVRLGHRLKGWREYKGWNQGELAELLSLPGIDQQAVSRMENNTAEISTPVLMRLRSLGLEIDSFFDEESDDSAVSKDPMITTLELLQSLYKGGHEEVHSKRSDALQSFKGQIRRESIQINITGSSLHGLTQNRDIWDAIVSQVRANPKLEVRILLTHPAFAVLRAFVEGRAPQNIEVEISEAMNTYFSNLKAIGGARIQARVALHPPTIYAMFCKGQRRALINPYTLTTEAYSTSTWIVRDTGDESCTFRQYLKYHFEEAWHLTKSPGRVSIPLEEFAKYEDGKLKASLHQLYTELQEISSRSE